jgi:hypothetical protein
VGLACAPAGPPPAAGGPAASPAAQAAGSTPDTALQDLQQQNAALQATLTAQQGQAQVVAAQQTQTALQTAVAAPPAAAAPAKPTEPPAAAKPNPTQPAAPTAAAQATTAPQPAAAQPTTAPAPAAAAPPAASTNADSPEAAAKAFMQAMVDGDVEKARSLMSADARSATSSDLPKLSTALRPCSGSSLNTSSTDSRGGTRTVFVTFNPACGSYNDAFGAMVPVAAQYTQKVFGEAKVMGCGVDLQQETNQWRVTSRTIGCPPAY